MEEIHLFIQAQGQQLIQIKMNNIYVKILSYPLISIYFLFINWLILKDFLPQYILYNEIGFTLNLLVCIMIILSVKMFKSYIAFLKSFKYFVYIVLIHLLLNIFLSFWVSAYYLISNETDNDSIGMSWVIIFPMTLISIFSFNFFFWKNLDK